MNRYQNLADMIYPSVTNTRKSSPDGDDDSLVDEDVDDLERAAVAAGLIPDEMPGPQAEELRQVPRGTRYNARTLYMPLPVRRDFFACRGMHMHDTWRLAYDAFQVSGDHPYYQTEGLPEELQRPLSDERMQLIPVPYRGNDIEYEHASSSKVISGDERWHGLGEIKRRVNARTFLPVSYSVGV